MTYLLDKLSRVTDPFWRKNHIEDDLLFDLQKMPTLMTKWRTATPLLKFFFFWLTLEQVLAIYFYFFSGDNVKGFQRYIAIGVASLIGSASYFTLWVVTEDFHKIVNDIFPRMTLCDSVGLENYNTLKRHALYARMFAISSLIVALLTGVITMPLFGDETELYYPLVYFTEHLSENARKVPIFLMYAGLFHFTLTVVSNAHGLLYIVLHLKFQMFILNKRLERMTEEAARWDETMVRDEEMQEKVTRELCECVDHHLLIKELGQRINDLIYFPIFAFTICGIAALVVIIFIYHYIESAAWTTNLRPVCSGLTAGFIISAFVLCGQVMEDESALLFESLYNLPWMFYNSVNKQIIIIMRENSYKPMTLSSSDIITLNYRLIIMLYKAVNSTMAFLVSMNQNKKK